MSIIKLNPKGRDDYIRLLSGEGYSSFMIKKTLKKYKINTTQMTISRVLNMKTKSSRKSAGLVVSPNKRRPLRVRTDANISFVERETEKENPPTLKSMAKDIDCSIGSVQDIISKDLNKKVRKKQKIHSLNARQMKQRKTAARRLYEKYLAKNRYKFIVSLDESWIYMSNTGGQRGIYYVRRGQMDDKNFTKVRERHPQGFMIAAAVSYSGKLTLIRVQKKAKINSDYYCKNILKPIYQNITKLYHKDDHKHVWFHQDCAPSHFSARTLQTLVDLKRKYGINFIPKEDIPVKSPDIAIMDFCVFGLLKQAIQRSSPKDLSELWKVVKREWRKLSMTTIRRALMAWKYRCRLVVKKSGHHIENVNHSKKVYF
jgi:hypothetical protein